MFHFHVQIPCGQGWKQLCNEHGDDYKAIARSVHQRTGAKRVKLTAMEAAAAVAMGAWVKTITFVASATCSEKLTQFRS